MRQRKIKDINFFWFLFLLFFFHTYATNPPMKATGPPPINRIFRWHESNSDDRACAGGDEWVCIPIIPPDVGPWPTMCEGERSIVVFCTNKTTLSFGVSYFVFVSRLSSTQHTHAHDVVVMPFFLVLSLPRRLLFFLSLFIFLLLILNCFSFFENSYRFVGFLFVLFLYSNIFVYFHHICAIF